jgi:sporulation protein YlmC with PRC-barrel domain
MTPALHRFSLATLALASLLVTTLPAHAQVAGATTTVGVAITESTQLAMGWSVKKTLLGKTIYNDAGRKVGKVEDLIISPDREVSYVIVGAGGFIGIGRHDVAIPVNQVQNRAGRLVMPGATPDMIKAMPVFAYANETARRDQFMAAAERDIAKGKSRLADLETASSAAGADAKAKIASHVVSLRADVSAAEGKLDDMKQATAVRWHEFEAGVNAATARLRRAIDQTVG